MHEIALVRSLMAQVEQIVADQGGGVIKSVRLRCGSLAGVEPTLLLSAFSVLRGKTNFADVSLTIDEVPLQVHCQSCKSDFEPSQFRFACPHCGSADTEIVQGDDLLLESIEVEPATLTD